jgi:hypothetical protein
VKHSQIELFNFVSDKLRRRPRESLHEAALRCVREYDGRARDAARLVAECESDPASQWAAITKAAALLR